MAARHKFGSKPQWSRDEERELWRLYYAGHSYADLAARFHRVEGSVRQRVRKLKHEGGPQRLADPRATKRRTCLCCRRQFDSTWIGNRVCGKCRETEAFA